MRHRLKVDRLRLLVEHGRISQNHWALKLGLSRGHWSDLLNGRHPYPSRRTRERLLEVFGVAEAELFVLESDPDTPEEVSFRRAISGRFTLTETLGQGGTGVVHGAQDIRLGRMVAVKVVQPEAAAGIGVEQLLLELSHVAQLHHPNILPLFDAGIEADQPYLVMPLIRDGSLRDLLARRTRLPLEEAIRLLDGVARALAHAHSRQILHCDVKPENILVQGGHPFVMDFGIARRLHGEADEWAGMRREIGFSAGTPAYVSPEQAAGGEDLDQRSDVYSLACVAYEMLSGRVPFEGTSTREVVSLRFRNPPPPLRATAPDVPQAVAEVIARGMALRPDGRPDSALAFVAELRAASSRASRLAVAGGVALTRGLARVRSRLGIEGPARLRLPLSGGLHDMHYTLRSLRRDWRFALSIVLSLGLGLGVGLPSLGLADHLLLRPPPGIADPDQVMRLNKTGLFRGKPLYDVGMTGLDFTTFEEARSTLSGIAAYAPIDVSIGRGAEARSHLALLVSAGYFDVLGVKLHRGRSFTAAEDAVGAVTAPCVVSYRYWQRQLGGTADAIGTVLRIGEVDYVVTGVAPEDFNGLGLRAVDLFLPIHVASPIFQGVDPTLWTSDGSSWMQIIGRLHDGVGVAASEGEMDLLYRRPGTYRRDPERERRMRWESLIPGRSFSPTPATHISRWLSGGALLLLLLIWANLTNLFIARAAARARETAIRVAIGGGTGHLVRLYAIEALLLASAGAALGLLLAAPGGALVRALVLPGVTWARPVLDLRLAAIAIVLTVLSAGIATLAAVLRTMRADPNDLLRAARGGRSVGTVATGRARAAMLGIQAAVFAVLLTLSLTFVHSLHRALAVDHGFRLEGLMAVRLPRLENDNDDARRILVLRRALEAAQRLPGVRSASLGYMLPWQNNAYERLSIPGVDSPPMAMFDVGTPEHLATMGFVMREGRWIAETDRAGTEPVIVVNESMAKAVWPGTSAIGRCVRVGDDSLPCRTVVGVMRDARVSGGVDSPMQPVYYLPVDQAAVYRRNGRLLLFVQSEGSPEIVGRRVTEMLQSLAPDVASISVLHPEDNLSYFFGPMRVGVTAFSVFGALAGLVAAIGLSGVLGYLVLQQRHAFAVRIALGAADRVVVGPLLGRAIGLVAAGMLAGLLLLALLRHRLETILYQTRVFEPATIALTLGAGLTVAVVAALLPLRTALRIEPMRVLRDE